MTTLSINAVLNSIDAFFATPAPTAAVQPAAAVPTAIVPALPQLPPPAPESRS